ncbi:MAG: hypothetical protein A2580_18025 [Hydrogenophilales bacterium RIFOXYD1_FULL_62_11]|nr:MAG: hypothetical protein A2580_18025 [Hydrogenophilales bacterium RIFOXYD1_FULL_62_11]
MARTATEEVGSGGESCGAPARLRPWERLKHSPLFCALAIPAIMLGLTWLSGWAWEQAGMRVLAFLNAEAWAPLFEWWFGRNQGHSG